MIAHSRRSLYRPQPRPTRRPLLAPPTQNYTVVGRAATYTPQGTDIGHLLYCVVTASNSYGDARTPSNYIGLITGVAPVLLVSPLLTGTRVPGRVLSTDNGQWVNSPTGYAYQWMRDSHGNGVFSNIAGQTAATYTLTVTDLGCYVLCAVTATNATGSVTANSNQAGLVQYLELDTVGLSLAFDILADAQQGKNRSRFRPRPDFSM